MHYVINEKILDFSEIHVMGILNVTPDSFYDGGRYFSLSKAVDRVAVMIQHGATFIDIGGESTRPGSFEISEDEEVSRVVPIIRAISERFNVFISVNTSKALVIRESAEVGVHLINDIYSLSREGALEAFLSYPHLLVCLMHMKGFPRNMQKAPYYVNVVLEVNNYFKKQIEKCELFGITRSRLLLDPGFGFGKTLVHNYQLLSHIQDFFHFGLPLLIGISRKSMLDFRGDKSPDKRLLGSLACAIISALQGVQILRVHDVKETMEVLEVVRATVKNKGRFFI